MTECHQDRAADASRDQGGDERLRAQVRDARYLEFCAIRAEDDCTDHGSQQERRRQSQGAPTRENRYRERQQCEPEQRDGPAAESRFGWQLSRDLGCTHSKVIDSEFTTRAKRGKVYLKLWACVSSLKSEQRSSQRTSS